MGQAFFVLLAGIFAALSVHAGDCSKLVSTCDYYQCLEQKERCGPDGYYLKFAKHYCEKYQKNEGKYSDKGREFLAHIRNCLQDELEREIVRNSQLPRCNKIEKFAIGTHKYCYQQYDFCSLSYEDRTRVKLTAKKEIIHFQMLKFGLWLENLCAAELAF